MNPRPTELRTDNSLSYTSQVMNVYVILPAAGLGTRMAADKPKQFLTLRGEPILIHTLRAFASVARIYLDHGIIVAVQPPELEHTQALVVEFGFASRVRVVAGGDNRQESVSNGLAALSADASITDEDIILVH